MKLAFIVSIVVMIGFMIYGTDMIKQNMPTEEDLEECIGAVKQVKELFSRAQEASPDEEVNLTSLFQPVGDDMPDLQNKMSRDAEVYKKLGINLNEMTEVHAPVMAKLMKMFDKKKEEPEDEEWEESGEYEEYEYADEGSMIKFEIYSSYLEFSRLNMHYGNYYLIAGLLIFVFSLISNISSIYPLALLIGKSGFFIGRFFIVSTSISSVVFWLVLQNNIWLDAGVSIFLGPMAILAGSCLALKSFDPNFPIWNRLMFSMVLPLLSSLFLMGVNTIT
ncbi:hypothetical protein ACFLUV_00690 [Elusimicrobiota bacterium]